MWVKRADPAFFDFNNDALLDIVIGNGGYFEGAGDYLYSLTLYENTGTSTLPEFTFVDRDYLDLSTLPDLDDITPFFADIDGDNDKDLIAGLLSGKILFMENVNGNFVNAEFLEDNTNTDIDIGQSANPTLFDLNGNGTLDLIVGTRDGNLEYFENTGSVNTPEFTFRTDTLGGVVSHPDLAILRYSSPAFGDFDGDGKQDLLLGGADARVKFYSDIGMNTDVIYGLTNENFFNIQRPEHEGGDLRPRTSPATADISSDGKPEVLLGTNTGGLIFYSQDLSDTTDLSTGLELINDQVSAWPNPAVDQLIIKWDRAFDLSGNVEIRITDIVGPIGLS